MTEYESLACPPQKKSTFQPINDKYILAAENAIRLAWHRVKKKKSLEHTLSCGKENDITYELQTELNYIRVNNKSPGYDDRTFERPQKGAGFRNYNKSSLDKQPDLVICVCTTRTEALDSLNDAIFIECKIIDHGCKNTSLYANKGIKRFLDGEYAWRMPHALMLGYIRTSQKLPDDLYSYLDKRKDKFLVKKNIHRCQKSRKKPLAFTSIHNRKWVHVGGAKPGHIDIRHLWLDVY